MQTIKLLYETEDMSLIQKYQRQYSNCLRYLYNRIKNNPSISEIELRKFQTKMNNISDIDSWFFQSAVKEAKQLYQSNKDAKIIFGGKGNFIRRCKNLISKEEIRSKRLLPIYSIGESSKLGNRKFRLTSDNRIIFQPNRTTKIELKLVVSKNREKILSKLYELQQSKSVTITYKLDSSNVFISFDETAIEHYNFSKIENRVMAIDMNPNYIGFSVVDWKSSSEYHIVDKGVFSIKEINDLFNKYKGMKLSSDSKEIVYINNKRRYEVVQVVKKMIDKAIHYKCSLFTIEQLNIKGSNKGRGKGYNRLCNNMWCRDLVAYEIQKRCSINGINFLEVNPAYSSFVGNFIFREINCPDMVLASIEVGRRGYEYWNQYKSKTKEIKKNIIFPDISDFIKECSKSMEEFRAWISGSVEDLNLKELYYILKKSKVKYRLPLIDESKFSRPFNEKCLIRYYTI